MHADVRETVRRADEDPEARERGDRAGGKRPARDGASGEAAQKERGDGGAEREPGDDDERHRGEGVHRVVQHLREEPHPQHFEAESEGAADRRDDVETRTGDVVARVRWAER